MPKVRDINKQSYRVFFFNIQCTPSLQWEAHHNLLKRCLPKNVHLHVKYSKHRCKI